MQDERKKKPPERSTGRNGAAGGAVGAGDGLCEEPKKSKLPGGAVGGGKLSHRASSQELPRRQSVDRQNSSERGAAGGAFAAGGPFGLGPPQKSPCDSPGQSPPTGFPFSPTAALGPGGGGAGLRGSRPLGEFLKSAVHMDPQRKHLLIGGALGRGGGCSMGAPGGGAHLDSGSVLPLPLSFALPLHHRLTSGSVGDGTHTHPVQFLRRLDLSELLTHIPRHKLNTYHVRMEDDAQAGQGEELRRCTVKHFRRDFSRAFKLNLNVPNYVHFPSSYFYLGCLRENIEMLLRHLDMLYISPPTNMRPLNWLV